MPALELKLPPPVVTLLAALTMWLVSFLTPLLRIAYPGRAVVAGILVCIGATASFIGVRSFRAAKTTVNPMKPEQASALVHTGIYGWTRNPMYLGMLLILAGWGAFLSNPLAIALLPAYVLYLNRFQIGPEERALSALFGQEFDHYKARVRRWI